MLAGLPAAMAFLPFRDFDKDSTIAKAVDGLSLPDKPSFKTQKDWTTKNDVPFLE